MDLTTLARVKALLGKDQTDQDTVLSQLITAVSRAAESLMGRHVEEISRTEYYDVIPFQRRIALRGYGQLAVTTIHNDSERTYGAASLIDSADYAVSPETGIITFDVSLDPGPRALKVVYTGGLGTSAADVIANGYDDLVDAVDRQVVFLYQRRADPHVAGVTDPSGNVSFNASIDWLPMSRSVLESYRGAVTVI